LTKPPDGQISKSAANTDPRHEEIWSALDRLAEGADGEVMVRELKRRTAKTLELQSLNPSHADRTLAAADVEWIARIVWTSQ
jgi:hypothetical protein